MRVSSSIFDSLHWYRLRVELVNTRALVAMRSHPLSIFQAIIKAVATRNGDADNGLPLFFHLKGRKYSYKLREGARIPLEIFFPNTDEETVNRFTDDFIILTKTKEDAENILSDTESYLSTIGLKLKKEKTSIRPVSEGFYFLGIQFEKSAAKVEPEEAIKRLKKPLYITDRFLFLALNGEAIDIYKNRKLVETIPLRRLSEIVVMERVSFSSALLRQCVERNIPFTVTLDSGYFITTIKPDSKQYYELNAAHTRKFYSLSETERLSIAKEIAAVKLKNYIPLYKRRYVRGSGDIIKEFELYADRIYQASTIDEVRGYEGTAVRKHYKFLNNFIDDEQFHIQRRDRKKRDRINSLLNFGYYLLFPAEDCKTRRFCYDITGTVFTA